MTTKKQTQTQKTANKREQPVKKKKNNSNLYIVIGLITVLILTWTGFGLWFLLKDDNKGSSNKNTITNTQVDRSISGKSVEQDKKEALKKVQQILNDSAKSPTGTTANSRMESLGKNDFKVIDKSVVNSISFPNDFADGMKATTYQSLVGLNTVIVQKTGKNTIAPTSQNSYESVMINKKDGLAFVPLSVFTTSSNVFMMEMIWEDNTWKLEPYSLVNQINISASLSEGSKGATPTTK